MTTFETEEDFESAVMKAIENRLQLIMCTDYSCDVPTIQVKIKSSDGIVFKSDYVVK